MVEHQEVPVNGAVVEAIQHQRTDVGTGVLLYSAADGYNGGLNRKWKPPMGG
jgi:hypothetical protein